MKISKLSISGFRCFDENPNKVFLDSLTTFVGKNGTGKTAALVALSKMFGIGSYDRTVTKDDFYIEMGKSITDYTHRKFTIDVEFSFPELAGKTEEDLTSIPELFRHMIIEDEKKAPICRVYFEATYESTGTAQGEIETTLYWVKTAKEKFNDNDLSKFRGHDRSKIQVIYIPAHRDPSSQLKDLSGSYIGQFMKSILWSSGPKEKLKKSVEEVRKSISEESGVSIINHVVDKQWKEVNDTHFLRNPSLNFIENDVDKLIAKGSITFSPTPDGESKGVDHLSDGQKSLFYFSLLKTFFEINESLKQNLKINKLEVLKAFDSSKIYQPALTLFAIEEPENHLSPHYLGKLIKRFSEISSLDNSQVVFSSHSPSVLGRIDPRNIRYFTTKDGKTKIRPIDLPEEKSEEFKFIKNAVMAYPELYFAKLVLLGEGDTEEVIFKHLFEASGVPHDENFISVVPLAGRHVGYLWKLLNSLEIPFITLLDLDLGREGGGWGRIKYILNELIAIGVDKKKLLSLEDGSSVNLSDMHNWDVEDEEDLKILKSWIRYLRRYDVFYSSPLDLDMCMLNKYKNEYKSLIEKNERGPQFPEDEEDKQEYIDKAIEGVLGKTDTNLEVCYSNFELFPWYRYLFLQKSKPATHFSMLSKLGKDEFIKKHPKVLTTILARSRSKMSNDE